MSDVDVSDGTHPHALGWRDRFPAVRRIMPPSTGRSPALPDCLLIEGTDFEQFPSGGQLATARQLLAVYGSRLALVGICTDDRTPVGRWIQRDIDGARYWFYGIRRCKPNAGKPLVPARLAQYVALSRHRKGVLSLGVHAAIMQSPEHLFVTVRWNLASICYVFAGVANPLSMPRYRWAKPLATWFEDWMFRALTRVDVIFASADDRAIDALVARSHGRLPRTRVNALPTSYDSRVFTPMPRAEARNGFGVSPDAVVLVCCGRISRVKGWELLLEALRVLASHHPGVKLVFVGDGEDRGELERRAATMGIADHVAVTGFVSPPLVANWLNAADVAVVGSYIEGWSIAMLEALGCGKPIVTTDVSGAREMVRDGLNGFIVRSREPEAYAAAVRAALALPDARRESLEIARHYTLPELARTISARWTPLA